VILFLRSYLIRVKMPNAAKKKRDNMIPEDEQSEIFELIHISSECDDQMIVCVDNAPHPPPTEGNRIGSVSQILIFMLRQNAA